MSTKWLRKMSTRPISAPRRFPTSGFQTLDHTRKHDEENWDWYSPQAFYPARIGEVFKARYQVLGKLGYGTRSTAWLGRDLHAHKYVAMKICKKECTSSARELEAYKHMENVTTENVGALFIRDLYDDFKIQGLEGEHLCLVHEPLGFSLETFREQLTPSKRLSEGMLKAVLRCVLQAVDCLRRDARMIHTDLQAMNIHFRTEDKVWEHFEQDELTDPSPRKSHGPHILYDQRSLLCAEDLDRPVLCDFGEARFGQESYTDDIQPYVYRAPEVILNIPWSYGVDIWNVGVMIWTLFENKLLFDTRNRDGKQCNEAHLASMVAILGPPPLELLSRSETSWKYFNTDGTLKDSIEIPNDSLEASATRLDGSKKALFLDFVRKMLDWMPAKRHTAEQLLEHPWLKL